MPEVNLAEAALGLQELSPLYHARLKQHGQTLVVLSMRKPGNAHSGSLRRFYLIGAQVSSSP